MRMGLSTFSYYLYIVYLFGLDELIILKVKLCFTSILFRHKTDYRVSKILTLSSTDAFYFPERDYGVKLIR